MFSFEILPHTSDFRLKITGNSQKELFTGAISGMNSVLKTIDIYEKGEISLNIEIQSDDTSMLIIDFLSEVLSLSYIKKAIFNDIQFRELTEKKVIANIMGISVDGFDEDIKGVSYSEIEIKRNEVGELEAIVVFDI